MSADSAKELSVLCSGSLVWLSLCVLLCSSATPTWSQETSIFQEAASAVADSPQAEASSGGGQQLDQRPGSISGRIVDQSGANIGGARVKLTQEGQSQSQEVLTDDSGEFSFANTPPGPFQLAISSEGLAPQEVSGIVHPGEAYVVPLVMLVVAMQKTEVLVGLTQVELAQEQLNEQVKQRVFGFIPNFYVSYVPNAAPLTAKQKFRLAWKTTSDPVTFLGVGALAGIDQATDRWGAYGHGAEGYAKRFGATYGNVFIGTFLGGAVLPSVLKQDPRYFYKGSGSTKSRILYAIAHSVICKGDNGRWQPDYSSIIGNFAAGGISNLYYPPNDRNGAGVVLSNALIRIGETAVANIFQELIIPKLTPNLPSRKRAQSQP